LRIFKYPFGQKEEENDKKITINYNLNIIDTPGLFEQTKSLEDKRTNEDLTKMIAHCLEHDITKVHLIFFVCSYDEGIKDDELKAFTTFVNLFKGAEQKICLLISRAEGYPEDYKKFLVEEIKQHPTFNTMIELVGNRIFFTGSVKKEDYESGSIESIQRSMLNITEMRKILLDLIFKENDYCHFKDIEFYKVQKAQAIRLLEEKDALENEIKKLHQNNEENLSKVQEYSELVKDLEQYKILFEDKHGLKQPEDMNMYIRFDEKTDDDLEYICELCTGLSIRGTKNKTNHDIVEHSKFKNGYFNI